MKVDIDTSRVPLALKVVGVLNIPNGCCKKENVLVTQTKGIEMYSCQCACGGWCTSGHPTIEGAIAEWGRMSRDKCI